VWRQARDEQVIAREDGYTYIAALQSPDLRHTTKREGDTVVTSNVQIFFWKKNSQQASLAIRN
jgi:hypothetical protein